MIKLKTPLGTGYYLSVGDRNREVKFLQSNLNSLKGINIIFKALHNTRLS